MIFLSGNESVKGFIVWFYISCRWRPIYQQGMIGIPLSGVHPIVFISNVFNNTSGVGKPTYNTFRHDDNGCQTVAVFQYDINELKPKCAFSD